MVLQDFFVSGKLQGLTDMTIFQGASVLFAAGMALGLDCFQQFNKVR